MPSHSHNARAPLQACVLIGRAAAVASQPFPGDAAAFASADVRLAVDGIVMMVTSVDLSCCAAASAESRLRTAVCVHQLVLAGYCWRRVVALVPAAVRAIASACLAMRCCREARSHALDALS